MPADPLRFDDTSNTFTEVTLCAWHMRRIFWNERFWEKYYTWEFDIHCSTPKRREQPSEKVPDAEYNQELRFIDAATGDEIARCHWFLKADGTTPCASGFPDPKEIYWRGFNYHLTGKKNPTCEHCAAGITTYPDGEAAP